MKTINIYISILIIFIFSGSSTVTAQKLRTDANIVGHVVDSNGEHIPFATIVIKNTTVGTATDETGHFNLINMPLGKHTVTASAIGYKPMNKDVDLKAKNTLELKFVLEEDVLGIEEVVVTADRNDKHRKDASVIVNTLTPKLFVEFLARGEKK